MNVLIARLADHPAVLDELAAAFGVDWTEWYGPGGMADARCDLLERINRDKLPLALVALEGKRPIGALTLSPKAIHAHADFSPSLIGFWVAKERRNRGIGAQLLSAACDEARNMGYVRLHAATAAATSLFLRQGWREGDRFEWRDEILTAFSVDL